jgi:DNA polymerase-4
VGDLAATPVESLAAWLGRASAEHLSALAHNRDRRPVAAPAKAASIGSQQALGAGTSDVDELDRVLLSLAERVGRRLRAKDRRGRTVTVRLRFPGGRVITRSETVARPLAATEAIAAVGRRLLRHGLDHPREPVTLVGISVSGLSQEADLPEVLGFDEEASRHDAVERQVDEIRRRFGEKAVTRASLLGRADPDAPEEFRRLAERD